MICMSAAPNTTTISISPGFLPRERGQIAALYWQAFRGKLGPVMNPEHKALLFFTTVLDPEFALTARDEDGRILGLAGFKTADGALVGGDLKHLARAYGWFGATWRAGILSFLERKIEPGILLMDGIFVSADARGRGVGTALLSAIKDHAARVGLNAVRLDVIDTNPRAQALYEREGFIAAGMEELGLTRHLFGFRRSTRMECPVSGGTGG